MDKTMLVKHLFFSKKTNSNSIFCNRKKTTHKKKSMSMFNQESVFLSDLMAHFENWKKNQSKIKRIFCGSSLQMPPHVNFMYIKISITEGNQVDPRYAFKDLFICMRCRTKLLTVMCFWTQLSSFTVHTYCKFSINPPNNHNYRVWWNTF